MPYTFRIDPEARLVSEAWSGEITSEEIAECYRAQTQHESFREHFDGLVDLTEASVGLSFEELKEVSARQTFSGRWAFIAPHDHAFGMIRMYMVAAGEERAIGVFRTRPEALNWLRTNHGPPDRSSNGSPLPQRDAGPISRATGPI